MSRRGWVLFAAMGVIWGIPYLLIKVAVDELAPSTLVLARTVLAVVLLLPVAVARGRLPEVARVELGGLRFAVVHETGPAKGREIRCAADYPETDVLVFGHSHIPWDSLAPGGLRLLNPGSPTDRRRQPFCTYLTATVATGTAGAGTGRLQDVVGDLADASSAG